MELFPILESRNKLGDNIWYVISPTGNAQISGGVGSKLVSRESNIYVTCGAQPNQSFGSVYKISLDSYTILRLPGEFHPRYEHGAVLHKTKVVVVGGADTDGNRDDTQVMDLDTDGGVETMVIEGAPSPRTIHNVGKGQGEMWVWGGGDTGAVPVSDTTLHCLQIDAKEWVHYKSGGSCPSPRHGHVVACLGDKVLVHGGMSGDQIFGDLYIADRSQLDSGVCEWRQVTCPDRQPVARAAHSSAAHNNSLYIFGGFTGSEALDDLWRFDIETEKWTEVSVSDHRPPPRLDATITTALIPYSNPSSQPDPSTVTQPDSSPSPAPAPEPTSQPDPSLSSQPTSERAIRDITSLLHQAGDRETEPDHVELPPADGTQEVLVLFGGMDLEGNIFTDLYAIKL